MNGLPFLNVFVLHEGGARYLWPKGSEIRFDDATELVDIGKAALQEVNGRYIFPAVARFKLAPGMLVGIGEIPARQPNASIGGPSILLGGKWYELRGKGQNPAGARADIVRLIGRGNENTPGCPPEQIIYLFRLSDNVIYSWSD